MPFTFAHAAAALPFRRTRLIPSAVVVGCFAPDFEYFLRFGPEGRFGHTLTGLFAFDLPLALVMLWLFHRYAKEPLWMWLPESFRERVRLGPRTLAIEGFAQFALVLVSILVGATTHILWDSFTHPSSWLYQHWHLLNDTVVLPIVGPLRYSRLIQHASTAVGTIVLLVWFLQQPRAAASIYPQSDWTSRSNERAVFAVALIVALAGGALRAFIGVGIPTGLYNTKIFFEDLVVTTISVFWLEVVIYGIIRARNRSHILVN